LFYLSFHCQAYHRVMKSARLNCSAISFFRGSQREVEAIVDDFSPAGLSKREFTQIVNKTTEERFSFLNIDLERPLEQRYRAGFNEPVV